MGSPMANYAPEAKAKKAAKAVVEAPPPLSPKSPKVKNMTAQQKRELINNTKIAKRNDKEFELKEIKKKMNNIKFLHQQQMKNTKNAAKIYTLDFFKNKGNEIEMRYNHEISALYSEFDALRAKYFAREKKMAMLVKVLKM